jgi:hypothetical protein
MKWNVIHFVAGPLTVIACGNLLIVEFFEKEQNLLDVNKHEFRCALSHKPHFRDFMCNSVMYFHYLYNNTYHC